MQKLNRIHKKHKVFRLFRCNTARDKRTHGFLLDNSTVSPGSPFTPCSKQRLFNSVVHFKTKFWLSSDRAKAPQFNVMSSIGFNNLHTANQFIYLPHYNQ